MLLETAGVPGDGLGAPGNGFGAPGDGLVFLETGLVLVGTGLVFLETGQPTSRNILFARTSKIATPYFIGFLS